MRGDFYHFYLYQNKQMFQFTPLREGRRTNAEIQAIEDGFNSRPCVRGDNLDLLNVLTFFVSIHAPA